MSAATLVASAVAFTPHEIARELADPRTCLYLVRRADDRALGVARQPVHDVIGVLPPVYPEWLGDRSFLAAHGVRFPYVAGEMANGIATTGMVAALTRAKVLGFFGAAGLPLPAVAEAITRLRDQCGPDGSWGVNLIYSPHTEDRVADLLISQRVPVISASAYLELTPAVVRCAVAGLEQSPDGTIDRRIRIFTKVSRTETARLFMSPAPPRMLAELAGAGLIREDQARWAEHVPLAEDITVEADSGGHTDNRPLLTALPGICALRDELVARNGYDRTIRVGAAGGLGTPTAVAAAFAAGAAYVLTGSVNQACVESGVSPAVREMLARAEPADVGMSPCADMFELGVQVQVLKRETMFAARARRLYEVYRLHPSLEALPTAVRDQLEQHVLRASLDDIWRRTRDFWQDHDPRQVTRAGQDPKHRMALVFRWYLGMSSRWAIDGEPARRADYQVWCGPAMGAFNAWARGSFMAEVANRSVAQVAFNLMEGAAAVTRAQQLRACGLPVPATAFDFRPRPLS